MRRKYRPVVAIAVGLYIFTLWAAYRWGDSQRFPDGSMFEHLENQRRKKAEEAKLREPVPLPTAEARLNAGGPIFIAVRHDASRIVFLAVMDAASRFGGSIGSPRKIPVPQKPAAALAGLRELWEPDSVALTHLPEIISNTPKGESWLLQVSPALTMPVTIDGPAIAGTGCTLSAGFLASIPQDQQPAFAAMPKEYFVVRHGPALSAPQPQSQIQVAELPDWKPTADFESEMIKLLNQRMQQDVAKIDAELFPREGNTTSEDAPPPATIMGVRRVEWGRVHEKLTQGESVLRYQRKAFQLAPDGAPRLLVLARWEVNHSAAFLMSAWVRAGEKPTLLAADSSWSRLLRQGAAEAPSWKHGSFQTVLNIFDADHDGWGELLIYTDNGGSSNITLYRYTDLGLMPLNVTLKQDTRGLANACPSQN